MAYKEHEPTVYVVSWPEDRIIKVGYSTRQRWRKFVLRGAVVLALYRAQASTEAFDLEVVGDQWLRAHGQHSFTSAADGIEYLGGDGAGYRECFTLPGDQPVTDLLAHMNEYAVAHGCVDASTHSRMHAMPNATVRTVRTVRTERKNLQDPGDHLSVPDAPSPVDNRYSARPSGWHATVADEWFDSFISDLESDPKRVRRAMSELYRPIPAQVLRDRAYEAETERQRDLIRRVRGEEVRHG